MERRTVRLDLLLSPVPPIFTDLQSSHDEFPGQHYDLRVGILEMAGVSDSPSPHVSL